MTEENVPGSKYVNVLANNANNNNSVPLLSACQQWVVCNRQALKVYTTKVKLRLELELD
jgi:hypothetical protein